MFILYALVAGVIIGALAGGRLVRLADLRLHWAPLILGGFLVQVILFTDVVAARIGAAGPPLYVASTILVAVAVLRNVRVPGVPVIAVGAASNLAAILANGGYMPASPSALASLGKSAPVIYSNSAVVPAPALEWLTDRFALPVWVPFANVFSVGDVLLGVGVAILIATAMLGGTAGMRGRGAGAQPPSRRDGAGLSSGVPRRRDRRSSRSRGTRLSADLIVQGKPVVRRGRKARDLPRKTARLPQADVSTDSEGVDCEGQPGAPHMGPDAPCVDGPHDRRRTSLALTLSTRERLEHRAGGPRHEAGRRHGS